MKKNKLVFKDLELIKAIILKNQMLKKFSLSLSLLVLWRLIIIFFKYLWPSKQTHIRKSAAWFDVEWEGKKIKIKIFVKVLFLLYPTSSLLCPVVQLKVFLCGTALHSSHQTEKLSVTKRPVLVVTLWKAPLSETPHPWRFGERKQLRYSDNSTCSLKHLSRCGFSSQLRLLFWVTYLLLFRLFWITRYINVFLAFIFLIPFLTFKPTVPCKVIHLEPFTCFSPYSLKPVWFFARLRSKGRIMCFPNVFNRNFSRSCWKKCRSVYRNGGKCNIKLFRKNRIVLIGAWP